MLTSGLKIIPTNEFIHQFYFYYTKWRTVVYFFNNYFTFVIITLFMILLSKDAGVNINKSLLFDKRKWNKI